MLNAQGKKALTAQVMSASTSNQDVQPSNTFFSPELQDEALHIGSSAAENSTEPAAQPSRVSMQTCKFALQLELHSNALKKKRIRHSPSCVIRYGTLLFK